MEAQLSFAQTEYGHKKKTTRREKFLGQMEQVVPWGRLVGLIEPHYPKGGGRGRPPLGVERMLRVYFLQQWYGLADEALEDAVYDSQAMRNFAGIDLSGERVPDATTLLNFRHLLEAHGLTRGILAEANAHLEEKHLLLREGTLVDATILAAPSSTKNRQRARPAYAPDQKGQPVVFRHEGAHRGGCARSGLVHTVVGTAANESDISQTHALLHGKEKTVHADAGYLGVEKRPEILAAHGEVEWRGAARRGKLKAMPEGWVKDLTLGFEKLKARARALVEHPFHIVKHLFGHRKVRCRGLAKNTAQLHTPSSRWPTCSSPASACLRRRKPAGTANRRRPGRQSGRRDHPPIPEKSPASHRRTALFQWPIKSAFP